MTVSVVAAPASPRHRAVTHRVRAAPSAASMSFSISVPLSRMEMAMRPDDGQGHAGQDGGDDHRLGGHAAVVGADLVEAGPQQRVDEREGSQHGCLLVRVGGQKPVRILSTAG